MDGKERPPNHPPNGPPSTFGSIPNGIPIDPSTGRPLMRPPVRMPYYGAGMTAEMMQAQAAAAQFQMMQQYRAMQNGMIRPDISMAAAWRQMRPPMTGTTSTSHRPPQPVPIPLGTNRPMPPAQSNFIHPSVTRMSSPLLNSQMRPPLHAQSSLFSPPHPQTQLQSQLHPQSQPHLQTQAQTHPLTPTVPSTQFFLPLLQTLKNARPYNPNITEAQFRLQLNEFMNLMRVPLGMLPRFKGEDVPIHPFYQIVTSMGGMKRVDSLGAWIAVIEKMGFPGIPAVANQFRSLYETVLFIFEQVHYSQLPPERLELPGTIVEKLQKAIEQYNIPSNTPPVPSDEPKGPNNVGNQKNLKTSTRTEVSQNTQNINPLVNPKGEVVNQADYKPPIFQVVNTLRASILSVNECRKNNRGICSFSFDEVYLMLASEMPELRTGALGLLERLTSAEFGLSLPAIPICTLIIEQLCHIYNESVNILKKEHSNIMKLRPFEYLLEKSEQISCNLSLQHDSTLDSNQNQFRILESVLTILLNWSSTDDGVKLLAQQKASLLPQVIIASIATPETCICLTLDIYRLGWHLLSRIASEVSFDENVFIVIFECCLSEVEYYIEKCLKYSFILHPTFFCDQNLNDDFFTGMNNFNVRGMQYLHLISGQCMELLEVLCKMLSCPLVAANEQSINKGTPLGSLMKKCLSLMWRLFEQSIILALGLSFKIDQLGMKKNINVAEYRNVIEKIVHNPSYGLPDYGIIEISLNSITRILRSCSPSIYEDWCKESVPQLISFCDCLRRIWRHPCVDRSTKSSPLLSEAINAPSSHPYQILLLMYDILGITANSCSRIEGVGYREVETVIGWLTERYRHQVCVDLLRKSEMLQVAESLLGAIDLE